MYRKEIALTCGCGHGFDSALLTASVHAYVRLLAQTKTDVAEILRCANTLLIQEIEANRYVTMLLGRLDPWSHSFTYVNAGHPPGFMINSRSQVKAELSSTSMPIGVKVSAEFQAAEPVVFAPGDILMLLTDGILEAESPERIAFGPERVHDVVRRYRELPAGDIISVLYDEIARFTYPGKHADDITSVVIKRSV